MPPEPSGWKPDPHSAPRARSKKNFHFFGGAKINPQRFASVHGGRPVEQGAASDAYSPIFEPARPASPRQIPLNIGEKFRSKARRKI
jgi:hypothetical protein